MIRTSVSIPGDLAINPEDRDPPQPHQSSGFDDAWNDVLRALQPLTPVGKQEQPADEQPHDPDARPRVPDRRAAGETLDELQALMRHHANAASHQPASDVDEYDDALAEAQDTRSHVRRPAAKSNMPPRRVLIASIAVVAAVLTAVLVVMLGPSLQLFHGRDVPADGSTAAGTDRARPSAATAYSEAAMAAAGVTDRRGIEKAMADCDVEAANHRDDLYFLIVPLMSPTRDDAFWTPLSAGDIGSAINMLRSKDAMDGLSSGRLSIYSEPYRFSVLNAITGVTSGWPPATGVTKFIKPNASILDFRIGLRLADAGAAALSGIQFQRRNGECYWVSILRKN